MSNADPPVASDTYFLGVDGGGTKTHAVIVDGAGQERGRGHAGSANHTAVGVPAAVANLQAAVDAARQSAGQPETVAGGWIGLAGIDRVEDADALRPQLGGIAAALRLTNDAELVLGALDHTCGVALIAGTGSIAFGRNARGESVRAGGWGHVMGDEGSGYDIGRAALRAVTRAADGRGPATVLTERILEHWRLSQPTQLIQRVFQTTGTAELAALAPLALAAAGEGDDVASGILAGAAHELAVLAVTVGKRLGYEHELPLALGGSLLVRTETLREQVLAHVTCSACISTVSCVEDCALAAARALAIEHAAGI